MTIKGKQRGFPYGYGSNFLGHVGGAGEREWRAVLEASLMDTTLIGLFFYAGLTWALWLRWGTGERSYSDTRCCANTGSHAPTDPPAPSAGDQ